MFGFYLTSIIIIITLGGILTDFQIESIDHLKQSYGLALDEIIEPGQGDRQHQDLLPDHQPNQFVGNQPNCEIRIDLKQQEGFHPARQNENSNVGSNDQNHSNLDSQEPFLSPVVDQQKYKPKPKAFDPAQDRRHLHQKEKRSRFLNAVKQLGRLLFAFFTSKNPIWIVTTKAIKVLFALISTIFYLTISKAFKFLVSLTVWFWDTIFYPMTFPIRIIYSLLVITPLNLIKTILKKLKPLIVFLCSAIWVGVLVGMAGSFTHLTIGDWLFPLRKKSRIVKARQESLPGLSSTSSHSHQQSQASHQLTSPVDDSSVKLKLRHHLREAGDTKESRKKLKRKASASSFEKRLFQEKGKKDWLSRAETDLPSAIKPNQFKFTSATELYDHSTTARHRCNSSCKPISSSSNDDLDPTDTISPKLDVSKQEPGNSFSPAVLASSSTPSTSLTSMKRKFSFKTD